MGCDGNWRYKNSCCLFPQFIVYLRFGHRSQAIFRIPQKDSIQIKDMYIYQKYFGTY